MTTVGKSLRLYYYTFIALGVLLFLTVEIARHDFGIFNFPLTMLIASAKAVLILVVFMNLRVSPPLTKLFAAIGFIWLAILFLLTFADYLTRTHLGS